MTAIIIILGIVFLGLTMMVLGKTKTLLNAIDKKSETEESDDYVDSANNFNGIALFGFWIVSAILVVWSYLDTKENFLPEASSPHGRETDYWFWLSMAVIMVAFFIVNTFLFWMPYKYRYNKNRRAYYYPHNNKLELIWTVIPAIIMAGLVASGLKVWTDITSKAPANAEQIEIMGKQFNWLIRYGGPEKTSPIGNYNYKMTSDANESGVDFTDKNALDDFSSNELVIPKGVPVELKIRARDVLHSVFIPHMRVKMDAVPGMPTTFHFIADKSTADMQGTLGNPDFKYELACTEVCGRGHFSMKINLIVLEQEEYYKWKSEQKPYLVSKPELMALVPANLKAEALKLNPEVAPADSSTVSVPAGSASNKVSFKK
jgi:cytochrome c oxidase subunit II